MDLKTSQNILTRCIEKYKYYCLFMLRSKVRSRSKSQAFFHIFHLIQLLTLIFMPNEAQNLPWNYSSLKTLWIGLSIVTRPDYLALYFDFIHVWGIYASIICVYLLTKLYILFKIQYNEIHATLPEGTYSANLIQKYSVNLHKYSSHILFLILPMSTLQAFLGMKEALNGEMDSSSASLISTLNLIIYLLIYLEDALFLQKLSWVSYMYHEVISSATYVLIHRVLFVAANFWAVFMKYDSEPIVYGIVLMGIGGYQAYIYAVKQPYGAIYRNVFIGTEGLMLFWAGFVLLLAYLVGYTSQISYFATLIYFLPIVFLIYIYKELIYYLFNRFLNTKTFLSSAQIFHVFLAESVPSQKSNLNFSNEELKHLIKSGMIDEPDNLMYSIWLIYLLTLNEKLVPVKVLISELIRHKNIRYSIYILQAREDFYDAMQLILTEREAFEYILYISNYSQLLEADRKSTSYLINLYNDLLSPQQDSRVLSRDIHYFHSSILQTRHLYSYMISVFNKSPNMYEMYSGFLEVIENSPDARGELIKARKNKQEIFRKEEAKEMEIIYFDNRNLILIISAEIKTLGNIIDVKNSDAFGYKAIDLENENVRGIFPTGIYESYEGKLREIHNIWNVESSLELFEQCYIVVDGYLSHVFIRNNVINLTDGHLAVILALKLKANQQEIAILDDEGIYIQYFVTYI